MNTATLGKLVVYIAGDTTDLDKGKRKAEGTFRQIDARAKQVAASIRRNIGSIAPWVTAAGAAAVFTRSLQRVIDKSRELTVVSQQTGISTQALQMLGYAAEQSGSSFQDLTGAVNGFSQAIQTAVIQRGSEAAVAFNQLGVSLRNADGSLRTFEELLPRVADKFAGWADGAEKASIANALFGGSGERLIPFLNKGSRGIAELAQEAKDLGLILSSEAIEANRAFERTVRQITLSIDALVTTLIMKYGPSIQAVIDKVHGMISVQAELRGKSLDEAIALREETVKKIEEAKNHLGGWANYLMEITGNNLGLKMLEERLDEITKRILVLQGLRGGIFENTALDASGVRDNDKPKPKGTRLGADEHAKEMEKFRAELDLVLEKLNGLPNALGEMYTINVTSFQDAIGAIDTAVDRSVMTQEQATRKKLELARQEQDTLMETAQVAASALTSIFGKSKGAAIASAIINTAVGVTRAFRDVPWPYNLAQAALVAATGAAQIASIRSTNQNGGGSSPRGPASGSGGGSGNAPAQATSRSLTVQGVDPSQMYSGAVVGNLIRAINVEVQNGATLIATRNVPF